jgi:hypothetical protein
MAAGPVDLSSPLIPPGQPMPSTVVGAIAIIGTQLRIQIQYIPDMGVPTVYIATVSEGKHLLQSYRESNVTTGDSGMNTNTIATVDRATFRSAFESWAKACAKRIELVGPAAFDPRTFTHWAHAQGLRFGSDTALNIRTIHSFPTGGVNSTVLTDPQYNLLKEAARAYYYQGPWRTAAANVSNVLGNAGRAADVTAVVDVLGVTRVQLEERCASIIQTAAWEREQRNWGEQFLRNVSI